MGAKWEEEEWYLRRKGSAGRHHEVHVGLLASLPAGMQSAGTGLGTDKQLKRLPPLRQER
jgi:hypothetical protein